MRRRLNKSNNLFIGVMAIILPFFMFEELFSGYFLTLEVHKWPEVTGKIEKSRIISSRSVNLTRNKKIKGMKTLTSIFLIFFINIKFLERFIVQISSIQSIKRSLLVLPNLNISLKNILRGRLFQFITPQRTMDLLILKIKSQKKTNFISFYVLF